MKFKRMEELDLRGKRVFIRADLNVPMEGDRITDDTRIRASVPAITAALEKGAALVMVTSHLGRPTEGKFDEKESLRPVARRLSELLEFESSPDPGLDRSSSHGKGRSSRELPIQQRREERRRNPRQENRRALRCLCERCVRHCASRRGHDAWRRALRQGGLRGAVDGGRARCVDEVTRESEASAGSSGRRVEGVDQAHRARGTREQGRRADRRRRHRQYLSACGRQAYRQVARRGRAGRRGEEDCRRDRGAVARGRGGGGRSFGARAGEHQVARGRAGRRDDSRHRAQDRGPRSPSG